MLFCQLVAKAQTPTVQDCLGAIPICQDTFIVPSPYPYSSGNGNYANEILGVLGCYTTELNGVWYTFTVQTSGLLSFTLTPDASTDYDWILFDMTGVTCAQLSTGAVVGAMESSNTYGQFGFNGPTGISTAGGGVGNCNGPGNLNGPVFNADLPVTAGRTYILYISNWSNSTFGFTLDFSASTAQIFDNIPPSMDTITSSTACAPFDSVIIDFDENVDCSTVQPGDFTLVGPGGTHTVTSVSSAICQTGANYDNTYTIYFTPAVSVVGNYSLAIQPGAGYVEDACGNLDTVDTVQFYYNGFVDVTIAETEPNCFGGCDGQIQANSVGGNPPFQFAWSGGLGIDSLAQNACAGTYTVTITDDAGCEATETIVLGEPTLVTTSLIDVTNLPCFGATVCEGGANISSSGGTPPYSFLWPSGEQSTSPSALCAGINEVTVTDANGCIDSMDVTVLVPLPIQTTGFGDTIICLSNSTVISSGSIGGTPPYSYLWLQDSATGPIASVNQGFVVAPLSTTTYVVISTDANGCTGDTAEVEVGISTALSAVFEPVDTICPYDTIDLEVEGRGGDKTYTYAWESFIGPSFTVSPDASRWYKVTVSDACGTPSYIDSVFVQVGGYSPINVELRADDDSLCIGEAATLIASTRGGHNGPQEFIFNWEHTPDNYNVQFIKPEQTKLYKLRVSDRCLSQPGEDSIMVHVGAPQRPSVNIGPRLSCFNSQAFIALSDFRENHRYDISLGDGHYVANYDDDTLLYSYDATGCYDVSIAIWTDFGCYSTQRYPCAVEILERPVAGFDHAPSYPSNVDPIVEFKNMTLEAEYSFWIIEDDTLLNVDHFAREFTDSDDPIPVTVIATHVNGCTDTLTKNLHWINEQVIYIPTSFTPNGDGLNDVFLIEGEEVSSTEFDLIIFDRWGLQVFRSNNPNFGWDGKVQGQPAPIGSYGYILRHQDGEGVVQTYEGQVVLSKSDR